MAASFDIVSLCLAHEEGILEEPKVFADGSRIGVELRHGVHRVAYAAGIRKAADSAHDDVKQTFYGFGGSDAISLDDVLEVNRPVEVVKIGFPLGVGFEQHALGESAEGEIFIEYGLKLSSLAKRYEFGEGKGGDLNGLAASAKDSGDVGNEELGVGSSDIDIDASHGSQLAEYAVEGDVCAFAVVGMDATEVNSGRKYFLAVLNLVDEHVSPPPVFLDPPFDVREKRDGVLQRLGTCVFKIDLDDVVFPDAVFHEMPLEEVEKKITLSASPDSGDDLHKVVVLRINYALQQHVSLDGHGNSPAYSSMDLSKNSKAQELYHNLHSKASDVLEILWISP